MTEKQAVETLKNFPSWNIDDRWLHNDEMEDLVNLCVNDIKENQQYRTIGTLEECREAREKPIPKKPIAHRDEFSGCDY